MLQNNDMASMIENDAIETMEEKTTEEKLSILGDYIKNLQDLEWDIELITDELKEKEKERQNLVRNVIPDFFDELGLSKIEAADGSKVEIKQFYAPSIKVANQETAYNWLIDNGYGTIIKHVVNAFLDVTDKETRNNLVESLEKMGYTFEEKKSIPAGTLKSFVNEQKEKGVDFPENTIDVFEVREAKITKPKNRKGKK